MDIKKIGIQALVAAVLFAVISTILEGDYSQEVWIEKGSRGLVFGVVYFIFLILKENYKKNKNQE